VKINTEVLIIGGGATGAGILRDLSLRGIPSVLVEKGDFASGASGRNHGLLHSGGRYAVSDPEAARECIAENKILRKIAPIALKKQMVSSSPSPKMAFSFGIGSLELVKRRGSQMPFAHAMKPWHGSPNSIPI